VPDDRIVVETDAPYLRLSHAQAEDQRAGDGRSRRGNARAVRGVSVEEIERLTTANAKRFFRWE
jgi:Tat protein secretion system quality control protein TatD with DNase activity